MHFPTVTNKRVCAVIAFLCTAIVFYNICPYLFSSHEISFDKGSAEHHFYRLDYCKCNRMVESRLSEQMTMKTTCSHYADLRGPSQKVVSFSFYGDPKNNYFEGIEINAQSIAKLYPGWVMRLYHNIDRRDEENTRALCDIICENPNLDDCFVDTLPPPLDSVSSVLGSMWRFLVLGDPTVDVFISRDLDAYMGQREVDAVHQWMDSKYIWHVLRDHVGHDYVMLAGMWGVKNGKNLTLMASLRDNILKQPKLYHKQYDQDVLRDIVWPVAMDDTLAHDSYWCGMFNNTTPYPTRRNYGFFVGNYKGTRIYQECPQMCRPSDHQDWKNC